MKTEHRSSATAGHRSSATAGQRSSEMAGQRSSATVGQRSSEIIGHKGSLKTVRVVAAVIRSKDKQGNDVIFAAQRGYGEFKGGWEFPGGKINPGETPEQALVREIEEELDTVIEVGSRLDTIEYDYPEFHLSMDCFWCTVKSGRLELLEHEDAKWLTKEQLDTVGWLPADITLIGKIKAAI